MPRPTARYPREHDPLVAAVYLDECTSVYTGYDPTATNSESLQRGPALHNSDNKYVMHLFFLSLVLCGARNMVTSFIYHERIRTTVPRAKELRKLADNMVTLAKKGEHFSPLYVRRMQQSTLLNCNGLLPSSNYFWVTSAELVTLLVSYHRSGVQQTALLL